MLRLACVFLIAMCGFAATESRAVRLERTLMAPCCWSENVAEHNSPIAKEVRADIERQVAAGVPDSQILAQYKAKYGARILTEPDGGAGVWLRSVPVVLIAVGFVWVCLVLRRWAKRSPAPQQAAT